MYYHNTYSRQQAIRLTILLCLSSNIWHVVSQQSATVHDEILDTDEMLNTKILDTDDTVPIRTPITASPANKASCPL